MAAYNDDSIDVLRGAKRVRMRPAAMLGSEGIDGARHGVTEILGNSIDEHSAGYGDRLDVKYYADGSVSVRDYGRGVPLGWNEKWNAYNWHIIYNELYGGGKYNDSQEELAAVTDWNGFDEREFDYLFSVGLNGLGAASTQYTSEYFIVESVRDLPEGRMKVRMEFKHGIPVIDGECVDVFAEGYDFSTYKQELIPTDEPTGTFIKWKPDKEVFNDVNIGSDWLYDKCADTAGVTGMELHYADENTGKDVVFEAVGLKEMTRNRCGDGLPEDVPVFRDCVLKHGTAVVEGKSLIWVCRAEICITFPNKPVRVVCFHNATKMKSGVQYEAVDAAITSFMDGIGRQSGVKFQRSDYIDGFTAVVSTYSNYASFRGQTKDAVDDGFIWTVIRDVVSRRLEEEYHKGNQYLTSIITAAVEAVSLRNVAKEAARLEKENRKVARSKPPAKFVSCKAYEDKDYAHAELWITEGDSALGGVKNARSALTQALYPIRGKSLNVLKAPLDRIIANKEIREIFSLVGTGLNLGNGNGFHIEDLKFDKIIFATDADEDGYHIRVLLYLIFYKLAPQLIEEGHVFIAESPRFALTMSNGDVIYCHNDAERDRVRAEGGVISEQRFKGLGEFPPEILRKTTVAPEGRELIPLTIDMASDYEKDFIDAMFGIDKKHLRKTMLVKALGAEVADMLAENEALLAEIESFDIDEDTEVVSV